MSVRGKQRSIWALAAAFCLLGLSAAPAAAAPQWTATLTNTPESLPRTDELIEYTAVATNTGDVPTSGPVTATLVLPPGGNDSGVFKVTPGGWTCTLRQPQGAQPARVECFRENVLNAGSSYPSITVSAQLGEEASEPTGTATFTVEGGGASTAATAEATYTFTAGKPFGIIDGGFWGGVSGAPKGIAPEVTLFAPPVATTITAVGSETLELSRAADASGRQALSAGASPFAVGEEIAGADIPPGTTITAVSGQKLTLSANTTNEALSVPISSAGASGVASMNGSNQLTEVVTTKGFGTTTAGSKVITEVTAAEGTFAVGQGIEARGADYTKAGGHPVEAFTSFGFRVHHTADGGRTKPTKNVKDIVVDVPRGFVGNAKATPELCESVEAVILKLCPPASAVGGVEIYSPLGSAPLFTVYPNFPNFQAPVFAVEPEYGRPAQFAFAVSPVLAPFTFAPELRADEGYAVSFRSSPVITVPPLYGTNVRLCNFGARFTTPAFGEQKFSRCKEAQDPDANPVPLVTNPTRCSGPPPTTTLKLDSWQDPDDVKTAQFQAPAITDCEDVKFEPETEFKPLSSQADSPTGLDVEVTFPTEGLETPEGISQAHLKRTRVLFPEGMAINASAGHGLGSCSAEQVKLETNEPIECPESSKIGSIEVDTPIIEDNLIGDVYLAKQGDVKGALTGFYIVFDSKENGILIKIPASVEPDPKTGQLVVTIDDSPEAPFSSAVLHFAQGPRSVLLTPPKCGKYEVTTELTSWAAADPDNPTQAETVTQKSSFEVTQGPGGGPCPNGGFAPKLSAGASDPTAGKTSPFALRLQREDGTQRFSSLAMKVPLGLTAYLKGVPYCPEGAIQAAEARKVPTQGIFEIASPSCPAASQIGTASAGAGAGSSPFYVDTGKAYLAGPYKGAPASIVVIAPAVAGPLDLGNVVIRNAIHVDPETAQVSVLSDPIPTVIHGILPDIRDIRVSIDRPNFTLNPTSCEEKSIDVDVKGDAGASASVSNRFQVGGCDQLKFKPTISTQLFGPTGRGGHPRLKGVLKAKPGQANIEKATVTIPRSEFLDQAHIRTICTRVQFAADACPKGSIYGKATAFTPLLDYPLSGPVYLRSSDNELPDMVVAVKGPDYQPIEAAVVARIDSVKGQIRANFESIPDVPLSRVVIEMRGGNKGLLINSRDICARTFRATIGLEGHNGASATNRPPMRNSKCAKAKKRGGKRGALGASGGGRAR